MYYNSSTNVRANEECIMSPWLFNVYMDACVRETAVSELGVKVGGKCVCSLLYVDDIVLL